MLCHEVALGFGVNLIFSISLYIDNMAEKTKVGERCKVIVPRQGLGLVRWDQCDHQVVEGSPYCEEHKKEYEEAQKKTLCGSPSKLHLGRCSHRPPRPRGTIHLNPLIRCHGILDDGNQCPRRVVEGTAYCKRHLDIHDDRLRCHHISSSGKRCPNEVTWSGSPYCKEHEDRPEEQCHGITADMKRCTRKVSDFDSSYCKEHEIAHQDRLRCHGITARGKRCSRKVKEIGSHYCQLHGEPPILQSDHHLPPIAPRFLKGNSRTETMKPRVEMEK